MPETARTRSLRARLERLERSIRATRDRYRSTGRHDDLAELADAVAHDLRAVLADVPHDTDVPEPAALTPDP